MASGRGNPRPGIEALSVRDVQSWAPSLGQILKQMGVPVEGYEDSSFALLCEEAGITTDDVLEALADRATEATPIAPVAEIEIRGGRDKSGVDEPVRSLILRAGEAIAVVGPTGSGKTRLLNDLETLAQGDTPSRRVVLVDGAEPDDDVRWSPSHKPVAQVSQSMSFLLNIGAGEFIEMHAASRGAPSPEAMAAEVIDAACTLCGEPFGADTALASLSGGQSRSLMIADAAFVSCAPIVVIDEIENAGIDRERALAFLVSQRKIALLATHDPLLALRASRRVVLKNGGIAAVLERSDGETDVLEWLEARERDVVRLRGALRGGARLTIG